MFTFRLLACRVQLWSEQSDKTKTVCSARDPKRQRYENSSEYRRKSGEDRMDTFVVAWHTHSNSSDSVPAPWMHLRASAGTEVHPRRLLSDLARRIHAKAGTRREEMDLLRSRRVELV